MNQEIEEYYCHVNDRITACGLVTHPIPPMIVLFGLLFSFIASSFGTTRSASTHYGSSCIDPISSDPSCARWVDSEVWACEVASPIPKPAAMIR